MSMHSIYNFNPIFMLSNVSPCVCTRTYTYLGARIVFRKAAYLFLR